ncbi:MAG TPA: YtxH domain-containing protein, partial [Solimonas sp.]
RTSDSIKLYYSWILPLLYGSLGAVVFLMRNTHNVRTPFLDSSDTLFRIAVGAIAGIVVGWFFSPDSGSSIREMSVAPLGVAFLAGFSIEALFGLLDRAVNAIHGQEGAT